MKSLVERPKCKNSIPTTFIRHISITHHYIHLPNIFMFFFVCAYLMERMKGFSIHLFSFFNYWKKKNKFVCFLCFVTCYHLISWNRGNKEWKWRTFAYRTVCEHKMFIKHGLFVYYLILCFFSLLSRIWFLTPDCWYFSIN